MIDESTPDHTGWARFSDDRRYRYQLGRRLFAPAPHPDRACLFVMLNPSTADAFQVDPTVRRCMGFATAWGCGTLLVGNLFALRSTDPAALYEVADPVGPDNDAALRSLAQRAHVVVCAWGVHGALLGRGAAVARMLAEIAPLYHLGMSKGGHPLHPLYLAAARPRVRWEGA